MLSFMTIAAYADIADDLTIDADYDDAYQINHPFIDKETSMSDKRSLDYMPEHDAKLAAHLSGPMNEDDYDGFIFEPYDTMLDQLDEIMQTNAHDQCFVDPNVKGPCWTKNCPCRAMTAFCPWCECCLNEIKNHA